MIFSERRSKLAERDVVKLPHGRRCSYYDSRTTAGGSDGVDNLAGRDPPVLRYQAHPEPRQVFGGGIREFRKGASGQYEEAEHKHTVELPEEGKLRSEDQKTNALAGEQAS